MTCAPPPEFADRRWHWLKYRNDPPAVFTWGEEHWLDFDPPFTAEQVASIGWTYWAPVEPAPAEPYRSKT